MLTPSFLDFQHFHLVGIKGVAMTSLTQCLTDAEKKVTGSDVEEDFVTQEILDSLNLEIQTSFEDQLPPQTECLIYTSAHGGPANPQVLAAIEQGIPTFSQAEALSLLFNHKQGIAVCGVGGKSTTSAMITWILERTAQNKEQQPSFSVGVGNIPGLNRTGQWLPESKYFVSEADEYVTDPQAPGRGEDITPRFSYLYPKITVCTNLAFDHPDVYKNFEHTVAVYQSFFSHLPDDGTIIFNADDSNLNKLASELNINQASFGEHQASTIRLLNHHSQPGKTIGQISYQDQKYELQLQLPGKQNLMSALAAVLTTTIIGTPIQEAIQALSEFRSTKRRSEFIGEKNGVKYYDDYAHHPTEVNNIIKAYQEWFPEQRLLVAFQSHTFSRTRELFDEFVAALATNPEIVMIDIFPSAREKFDDQMSSDLLCETIQSKNPSVSATNLHTLPKLADYLQKNTQTGDIVLTIGAGDIYHVHDLIKS